MTIHPTTIKGIGSKSKSLMTLQFLEILRIVEIVMNFERTVLEKYIRFKKINPNHNLTKQNVENKKKLRRRH